MHIDNPDALKTWLTHILEPLCDADPAALARYVLALLKKDKDVRELSRCMSEQLDVFLGAETAPFLARLFDSIASEAFLTYQPPVGGLSQSSTASTASTATTATAASLPGFGDDGVPVDAAGDAAVAAASLGGPDESDAIAMAAGEFAQQPGESAVPNHDLLIEHASPINSPVRSPQKQHQQQQLAVSSSGGSSSAGTNHHHQPTSSSSTASATNNSSTSHHKTSSATAAASSDSRRRRASARSRSRSRSRSLERSSGRGGGGSGRDRDGKSGRPYGGGGGGGSGRNKSPSRSGAYDRRGGNSRSWKSRSRSPVERRSKPQQQQPPNRSVSPSYGEAAAAVGASATGTDAKPSGKQPALQLQQQQRQRCRDFDEKGYCMRGETCPWDHGVDPVVLEDISNPALMSGVPHGRGAEYSPDAPELWTRSGGNFGRNGPNVGVGGVGVGGGVQSHRGAQLGGYNGRLGAGGGGGNAFRGPPGGGGGGLGGNQFPFGLNAPATTPLQRELISVPVLEAGGAVGGHGGHGHGGGGGAGGQVGHGGDISGPGQPKRRYDLEDTVAVAEMGGGNGGGGGQPKRKMPISGRLGPRVQSMQQNCSLELRKVPRGLNSIAHLNNHFSKFGKIINIQISYDGDAEAAIVTFSTHAEANVAYRSTEAVLNNRFIKVFWHSDASGGGKGGDQQPDGGQQQQQHHHQPPHLRHKGGPNQYSLNNTTHNNNNSNGGNGNTSNGHAGTAAGGIVPAVPTAAASTDAKGTATDATAAATTATTGGGGIAGATAGQQHDAVIRSRLNSRINRHNPMAAGAGAATATAEQLRRKQEENVKAAVELAHGLHKRKHELLQSYLQQLRSCLDKVERLDPTDAQRPKLLATIKSLQVSIDTMNKEIAAEQATMQAKMQPHHVQVQMAQRQLALSAAEAAAQMRRSREQHKKELLDIELELFAQQQEGNDTTQLQRRIEELQKSLGASPTKGGGGVGGQPSVTVASMQLHQKPAHQQHQMHHKQQQQNQFGGLAGLGQRGGGVRVRPAPPGSTSVDRRPTTLRVTGFEAVDSDVLLGHFKHFGEVTRNELDKAVPSLVIAFATRINAEQAMLRGRTFKDKQLQISWVSNPCVPPTGAKRPPADTSNTISAAVPPTDAADLCADAAAKTNAGVTETTDDDADAKTLAIGAAELTDAAGTQTQAADAAADADGAAAEAAAAAADVNSEEVQLPEDEEEEEDGDETEARSWRR